MLVDSGVVEETWAVPDRRLIVAARDGDDRALTELLHRYVPRVRQIASQYFLRSGGTDHEDLVQEGMIGLYKAICDFDLARHVQVSTFADVCIRRQLVTAVRAATRLKHTILDRAVWLDESGPAAPGSPADDPVQALLAREAVAELAGFTNGACTALERGALDWHLAGWSSREAAAALQIAPKTVDNALQRARRKVQGWLEVAAS